MVCSKKKGKTVREEKKVFEISEGSREPAGKKVKGEQGRSPPSEGLRILLQEEKTLARLVGGEKWAGERGPAGKWPAVGQKKLRWR